MKIHAITKIHAYTIYYIRYCVIPYYGNIIFTFKFLLLFLPDILSRYRKTKLLIPNVLSKRII